MSQARAATGADRITAAIDHARDQGRPAVAAFLTAGYPHPDAFADILARVAAEADIVEIGVPFSDPMADGTTIQRSSHRAIALGVRLEGILDLLTRQPPASPTLLMSYLNPLLAFGLERLASRAAEVGVAGLIVPDLPLEESADARATLDAAGLALVQLVSPVTPPDRLHAIGRASRGFVYAVTVTGITGTTTGEGEAVTDYLDRVRSSSPLPVMAGFGIRTPDHVRALAAHVDGVIVGSALIDAIDAGEDPAALVAALRTATL